MALSTEEIIIDLQLNADPSTKSLSQLEQELVNLKDALKNVAVGSDDFKKLQAEVIKADSRVKNLNKSIEGLDTEALAGEIGKLGGGITSTFTGVAAAIGSTSGEFEQFTQKIVTGIAVAEGIKGATEAWTAAQKLLNFIMAANPIGAVIAAVAALTAGVYFLVDALRDTGKEQRELNKLQVEYNNVVLEGEARLNALNIQILQLGENTEELIKAQQKQIDLEYAKEIADINAAYEEYVSKVGEAEGKTNEWVNSVVDLIEFYQTSGRELTNFQKDFIEENRELFNQRAIQNEKLLKAEQAKIAKEKLLNKQAAKDKLDEEKKLNEKLVAEREKFLEKLVALEEKYAEELLNISAKNQSLTYQLASQNLQLNKDLFDKELEALKLKSEEELLINEQTYNQNRALSVKELAEILKLNEDEINDKAKVLEATKKLNQEELVIANKLKKSLEAIDEEWAKNQEKLALKLQNEIEILQNQRKENFIDTLKTLENENERNSILLIEDIRKRNLKIIALEAGLAGDIIIEEIKKNEKIIELAEERKKEIEKGAFGTYEELTIIEEQLKTVKETNNALVEKLRLVGETAEKAKEEAKANTATLQALVTITERRKRLVEGQWARERDLTVENLALQTQLQLDALKVQYEQGLIVAEEYEMAKKDIEDEFRKEKIKADIAGYKKAMDMGKQLFSDFQAIQLNLTTDRINKELRAREAALEQEVRALDGAVEAGIMSEDAKKDAINKIDFERQKAQRKAAYDQAKAEKEQALVKIAIDTATAIVEAAPVIPLQIQAAILGASQAAVIQSQPLPQLKRGGRIKGPSHENGGVPLYKNGSQIAEVEGDELIMTKGVAQSPVLLNMASTLNQLAGGISFTNQSLSSTAAATQSMPVASIDEASLMKLLAGVTSIPVTNVSTETDRVARKVRNIEARSKF